MKNAKTMTEEECAAVEARAALPEYGLRQAIDVGRLLATIGMFRMMLLGADAGAASLRREIDRMQAVIHAARVATEAQKRGHFPLFDRIADAIAELDKVTK